MNLDTTGRALHHIARSKGFYDELDMQTFNSQAKQLAMIHSEVTEVLEALRKDKGEQAVVEEIADILIRVLDFYESLREAGVVSSSLDEILSQKTIINSKRDRMHGVRG